MNIKLYNNKDFEDTIIISFFYQETLKDKYLWELLEGTIDMAFKKDFNLQKKLMKNYDAKIDFKQVSYGNNCALMMMMKNLNRKYTMNNENISIECLKILLECIFNMEKYLRTVTIKEFNALVKDFKEILEKNKNSIFEYLLENINDPTITLDTVTLEDVILYSNKILKNSKVFVQIISDDETANDILKNEEFKCLENLNYIPKELSFNKLNLEYNYIENVSDKLPTEIDFILQRENLKIDEETIVKNKLLTEILNMYVFNIVREENSLSYNPNVVFNDKYNFIHIRANFNSNDKEKVQGLITQIIENIKEGKLDYEFFEYSKNNLKKINSSKNFDIYRQACEDLKIKVTGFKFNLELLEKLTKQDIINHLKSFETKLIYYLGGK